MTSSPRKQCKAAKRRPTKPKSIKPAARPRKRGIIKEKLQWRDVTLAISYERDWTGTIDTVAHLEIHVLKPQGAIIPLTDTGYRSHFTSSVYVDGAGGPAKYVAEWLDAEAATPAWRRKESAARQLSLF